MLKVSVSHVYLCSRKTIQDNIPNVIRKSMVTSVKVSLKEDANKGAENSKNKGEEGGKRKGGQVGGRGKKK